MIIMLRGTQENPLVLYVHMLEHVCDPHEIPSMANREEVGQERKGDSVSGSIGTWQQFHLGNIYSKEL